MINHLREMKLIRRFAPVFLRRFSKTTLEAIFNIPKFSVAQRDAVWKIVHGLQEDLTKMHGKLLDEKEAKLAKIEEAAKENTKMLLDAKEASLAKIEEAAKENTKKLLDEKEAKLTKIEEGFAKLLEEKEQRIGRIQIHHQLEMGTLTARFFIGLIC